MPKQVVLKSVFPEIGVVEAYEHLFGNKTFADMFHSVRKDIEVDVTEWIESADEIPAEKLRCRNKRVRAFKVAWNCPAIVKSYIGVEHVAVKSTELAKWNESNSHVEIHADCICSGFPAADLFISSYVWKLVESEEAGLRHTQLEIVCDVEFGKEIWGVKGAIESFMVYDVNAQMEKWIKLAHFVLERKRSNQNVSLEEFYKANDL